MVLEVGVGSEVKLYGTNHTNHLPSGKDAFTSWDSEWEIWELSSKHDDSVQKMEVQQLSRLPVVMTSLPSKILLDR